MPFLNRKKKETAAIEAPPVKEAEAPAPEPVSVNLSENRLSGVFRRMYLFVLSVNLNTDMCRLESGEASFRGERFEPRMAYTALVELLASALIEDDRERFRVGFSARGLYSAWQSGRRCVTDRLCAREDDPSEPYCVEFRAEYISAPGEASAVLLLYARHVKDELDAGPSALPAPVDAGPSVVPADDIDWKMVRANRAEGGETSIPYEYSITTDTIWFHIRSATGPLPDVKIERFLSTIEARSDVLIAHESVRVVSELFRLGKMGQSGKEMITFRTGARRSSPFSHFRMTCEPYERNVAPTWLFGVLEDREEEYKLRQASAELTTELSQVVNHVFTDIFLVNTEKDTICRLVNSKNGYLPSAEVYRFTDSIRYQLDTGAVAEESRKAFARVIEKGYLERVTARHDLEIEINLRQTGTDVFSWVLDTYSMIDGRPHQFMLSRRDDTANHEAHLRAQEAEEKRLLEQFCNSMLTSMANVLESRSQETGHHVHHVCTSTRILLEDLALRSPQYELTPHKIDLCSTAATMHDIGKIAIPDAILKKPGKFTPEEYEQMKTHAAIGAEIISGWDFYGQQDLKEVCVDVARHHHERWDGSGYPDGLVGDAISIYAQAVGMADVYDALVSQRCYKKGVPVEQVEEMLINGETGSFNPRLIASFQNCRETLRTEYQHLEESAVEDNVNG